MQDVELAESGDRLPDRGLDLVGLRDIGMDEKRLAAGRADLVGGCLACLLLMIDKGDCRAFLREQQGRCLADSKRRAGDERYLAVQTSHGDPPDVLFVLVVMSGRCAPLDPLFQIPR